eukprot:TRINITY_DN1811_c0_g1_i2.p1 TRINITY_DN1811_c0_g1~~TRINITY_DN1811_c0_g1_i2.p1  ORF type:complete len:141 (+),score=2.70 TRINITY_DN1811_c0_g1_i2:142-564(+)
MTEFLILNGRLGRGPFSHTVSSLADIRRLTSSLTKNFVMDRLRYPSGNSMSRSEESDESKTTPRMILDNTELDDDRGSNVVDSLLANPEWIGAASISDYGTSKTELRVVGSRDCHCHIKQEPPRKKHKSSDISKVDGPSD